MRQAFLILLPLLWLTHSGLAAEQEVPTRVILPGEVVPGSVMKTRMSTDKFVVSWRYTEEGARKALAFWEANQKTKTRMVIGKFEKVSTVPRVSMSEHAQDYEKWKQGWLKRRTDKILGIEEKDADAIASGLKVE